MHESRLENLFGAAALAATGAMTAAMSAAADGGLSAAAALVTLAAAPEIGVTELARRLGLSQPGTSRLVEGLAARGLVLSQPEPGGRTVALSLTAAGTGQARLVLAQRQRALAAMLAPLDEATRAALDAALSAVLERLTDEGASAYRTCRLCDEHACAAAAPCPVDHAWQRRDRRC
jgi:DNA-binding MarR family transcriptional regulator